MSTGGKVGALSFYRYGYLRVGELTAECYSELYSGHNYESWLQVAPVFSFWSGLVGDNAALAPFFLFRFAQSWLLRQL